MSFPFEKQEGIVQNHNTLRVKGLLLQSGVYDTNAVHPPTSILNSTCSLYPFQGHRF